jgi:SAM-dependent methyltransferase
MNKMMSMSERWSFISKAMYGQEFIDELVVFFKKQGIESILECGCGDGRILKGLAEKGLKGRGIDADEKTIYAACEKNNHVNIKYGILDWLDLDQIKEKFDAVMCRGNGLVYVDGWTVGREHHDERERKIEKSIELMFNRVNDKGLLMVDTLPKAYFKEKNIKFQLEKNGVDLEVQIKHFYNTKTRHIWYKGKINNEEVQGEMSCHILYPGELMDMMRPYANEVWCPTNFKHETNLIICGKKK